MKDTSIYNMSQRKEYSFPPPLPVTCNGQTSELYQVSISDSASSIMIYNFREVGAAQILYLSSEKLNAIILCY